MKILLLGKNGQIGWELERNLILLGEVIALDRSQCDLSFPETIASVVQLHKPDVIVNAAAYTAVDKAEEEEGLATVVNGASVGIIAEEARKLNALLIHYSTDYVFDGSKDGAYVEADITNPLSAYGRSKRKGEEVIMQSGCNALIFRTSWIFSVHGYNFIKTILKLARERESINVVADQHGAPTSAELIADVTALAISGRRCKMLSNGIYHLTAAGETTWHSLACYVVSRALENGASLMLSPQKIYAITAEEYPLKANRPSNSCMSSAALTKALDLHLPDWRVHVDRVVDQLTRLDAFA